MPAMEATPPNETTETTRPARPRRGDELELRIDSLAQGGRGVARTEQGFVIFVGGGLPGDRIRARVGKSKRSWAEAAVVELLEAAPERIADSCVHGGESCPGAAWQGLPYEAQLAHKQDQVSEALVRIGGFEGIEVDPIVPAVEQWRYRNKLEYSFGGRHCPGRPRARLPRPRGLGDRRRHRRLPARLRGQQRCPQRDPRVGGGRGGPRLRQGFQGGGAAQPDRPRGTAHGPAADSPRHLRGRDPRAPSGPAHDGPRTLQRNLWADRGARRGVSDRASR